jgi:hypothetical protein
MVACACAGPATIGANRRAAASAAFETVGGKNMMALSVMTDDIAIPYAFDRHAEKRQKDADVLE